MYNVHMMHIYLHDAANFVTNQPTNKTILGEGFVFSHRHRGLPQEHVLSRVPTISHCSSSVSSCQTRFSSLELLESPCKELNHFRFHSLLADAPNVGVAHPVNEVHPAREKNGKVVAQLVSIPITVDNLNKFIV